MTTQDQVLSVKQIEHYRKIKDTQEANIYLGAILHERELSKKVTEAWQKIGEIQEKMNEKPADQWAEDKKDLKEARRELGAASREKTEWSRYSNKVEQGHYTGLEKKCLSGRIGERFANANLIAKFFMVVLFPLVVITEFFFEGNPKAPGFAGKAEAIGERFSKKMGENLIVRNDERIQDLDRTDIEKAANAEKKEAKSKGRETAGRPQTSVDAAAASASAVSSPQERGAVAAAA